MDYRYNYIGIDNEYLGLISQYLLFPITCCLSDEMKIYQQAQQEYKNALKQKAKRQIVAIKPDATDEQGT
jgi:hypothetical protein